MARMTNKVELALYLEEAASALGVRAQDVREELLGGARSAPPAPRPPARGVPRAPLAVPREERQLVWLLLREPGLAAALGPELDPADLAGPGMAGLVEALRAGREPLAALLAGDEALSGFVSRLELEELAFPAEHREVEARGCLRKIRERRAREQLDGLRRRLGELEGAGGGREEMEQLQAEIGRLQARCREPVRR